MPFNLIQTPLALAAAATVLAVGGAAAQTQPGGQAASPFWQSGSGSEADATQESNGFPTSLVERVAPARAGLAIAQAEHDRAQSAYADRLEQLKREYAESSEYRDARQAILDARAAVDAAETDVLAPLEDDADYQAAAALQNGLASRIAYEHRQAEPDHARIRQLSEEALQYARLQSDREQDLLENAPEYQRANDDLRGAVTAFRTMEREHLESVRTDDELANLREAVTNARTTLAAADAYASAAEQAAGIAVDYARERQRLEYGGGYGSPYCGYGGGGGYGVPYGFGYSPYGYYGGGGYNGGFVGGGFGTFRQVGTVNRVIPTLTNSVTNQTPGALGNVDAGGAPDPDIAAGRVRTRD